MTFDKRKTNKNQIFLVFYKVISKIKSRSKYLKQNSKRVFIK